VSHGQTRSRFKVEHHPDIHPSHYGYLALTPGQPADEAALAARFLKDLARIYHRIPRNWVEAAGQMVERLVQQGFLERTEDPYDRRTKQLTLTAKGRALAQKSIEARPAMPLSSRSNPSNKCSVPM